MFTEGGLACAQRHAHDEMTKAAQIKAEEAAGELARERAWRIKLQEESAIQMDQVGGADPPQPPIILPA